jgi:hypothetical protein
VTQQQSYADIVNAGIAKGGGWFGSGGLPTGAVSGLFSGLPNYALVGVGIVLAVGALLISTKQTAITVVTKAQEAIA